MIVSLQTSAKACVPDSEKPQPHASAAFPVSPLPTQHPRLKSNVLFHIRALQPGGHPRCQLHIW